SLVKDIAFVADRAKLLAEGAESGGVGRVRMNHAVDVGPRFHDFGVDKDLGVTLVLAFQFLAAADIDHDDMLRADFLEAEAMRLHEDAILAGYARRNVAETIVPLALVREDVAGVRQVFLQLFNVRSHVFSLTAKEVDAAGPTRSRSVPALDGQFLLRKRKR